MLPYEGVQVLNITNGARLYAYAIEGAGTARFQEGDRCA